jgi:hypothetical protein
MGFGFYKTATEMYPIYSPMPSLSTRSALVRTSLLRHRMSGSWSPAQSQ